MSQSTVSHYSSRNLDACTLQLKRWRPFVTPPASEAVVDFHQPGRSPDIEVPVQSVTGSLDINLGGSSSSGSPALHLVKCSFKQMLHSASNAGECFRWSCHPFKEDPLSCSQKADPCKDLDVMCGHSDYMNVADEDLANSEHQNALLKGDNASMLMNMDERSQGVDIHMRYCYEKSLHAQGVDHARNPEDTDFMADMSPVVGMQLTRGYLTQQAALVKRHGGFNTRDTALMSIIPHSTTGWNKRQKQLSRALARGLWRWKEHSQARKRRRKCGSSQSCSGRSSESRRARFNGSDAPTISASAAYATCSDFPMPGTDSSGELFFHGDSTGINWDSEVSLSGEGMVQRIDGVDVLHAWIIGDSQNLESGYGSDTGYRGDGEFGYGDDGIPDEQDEEERTQLGLGPWDDNIVKKGSSVCGITVQIPEDEDSVAECKLQHHLRRRRQELRLHAGLKSKESM
ncbi:hypothetical protein KP509_35G031900 [Ceratopteris richardii]|uniref:Uncharacterized protein n=1 Tax=Ceratopteris richardii TaxID=49495 RepID=A0A8T2QFQ3_CERRI|nr:hypothetical protein KP509_35G031900 [Ceratopteris richardii]